jgi:hypothetical protein
VGTPEEPADVVPHRSDGGALAKNLVKTCHGAPIRSGGQITAQESTTSRTCDPSGPSETVDLHVLLHVAFLRRHKKSTPHATTNSKRS